MVGRRKISLRLLQPEGYTGYTTDRIIKELSISFFQHTKTKNPHSTWLQTPGHSRNGLLQKK